MEKLYKDKDFFFLLFSTLEFKKTCWNTQSVLGGRDEKIMKSSVSTHTYIAYIILTVKKKNNFLFEKKKNLRKLGFAKKKKICLRLLRFSSTILAKNYAQNSTKTNPSIKFIHF